MGMPSDKRRIAIPDLATVIGQSLPPDRNVVLLNVLQWIHTYELGRGFPVTMKTEKQGPKVVTKSTFSSVG
jgi:hypothetical protein